MSLDRRTFLALCAATGFGALTACSTSPGVEVSGGADRPANGGGGGGRPAAPITSVVMIGDSIAVASAEEVQATLTAAGISKVRVEAEVGRRIEVGNGKGGGPLSGIRTLFNVLAEGVSPDAWVVELGTNDVGSYATPDEYGALVDELLGMLPDDVPLVWVNVYRPQYLDLTNMFNMVLQQRIGERGHAVVADWFSAASAPDSKVLRADDLHPNDHGQTVLATVVLDALQQL